MLADFSVHLANCGYRPQSPIIADGKLRRVSWEGRKKRELTGWYVAHDHGDWGAAAWGDWREGFSETWCSKEKRKLSPTARVVFAQQMAEAKEEREKAEERARKAATERAWVIWCASDLAEWHPYLLRKGITGQGLRVLGDKLVIPMRDAAGQLRNVQRIWPDGAKKFVKAAAVAGLAWYLGKLPAAGGDVVICEGVATAATARQLSGFPTVAAINAGNLLAIAEIVRARCPEARILIAADDDRWERNGAPRPPEKNVGIVKGRAAALAVNGLCVVPAFADVASRGTDWNDLMLEEGEEAALKKWAAAVKVAGLDAQLATLTDSQFDQKKKALASAYRSAGEDASPRALATRRKETKEAKKAAGGGDDSPADILAAITAELELWHDQFGQPCATFELNGRMINAKVEGQTFLDWLRMAWEDHIGTSAPPPAVMMSACIGQIASKARQRARREESFVRLGWLGTDRFLDLGRDDWSVVRINADGWEVIPQSPVKFTRSEGNWELPVPVRMDGGINPLWKLLNVAPEDRCLIAGWLLGALQGTAPAFGLNIHGTQGTAKSTATRILRRLVDPAPGLTQPLGIRRIDDLPLTCIDQWIPCFENISWLEDEVQDALCMLTTGLSLRNRKLYTNDGMVSYNVRRPWAINGINNVCSRNDLSERAVPVGLLSLDPAHRRREAEIEAEFLEAWPGLLAALLDAAVMASAPEMHAAAVAMLEREKLSHRMADALAWITAGEEALGFPAGSFIRRLIGLQEEAGREALEDHPVVVTLLHLLGQEAERRANHIVDVPEPAEWTGSNDDLIREIEDFCPGRKLPRGVEDARKLGMWLKREADRLRTAFGIEVGEVRRKQDGFRGEMKRVRTFRML